MNLTYGSVCSGIEAATVAWSSLGWKPAWFSQFDPEHNYSLGLDYPSKLLNHHYPHVENIGDMTKLWAQVEFQDIDAPDVLVGGTPCQAFSIAGLRKGLSDSRGQLSLSYVKLANSIDKVRVENGKPPAIIVWENVPGVLNTKDNAFGCFLTALCGEESELDAPRDRKGRAKKWPNSGCVFGPQRILAWRVLDAQYFGLAQRRKRVFVVASAMEGFHPAQVLLEFEGSRRDIAPSRSAGEEVASTLSACSFTGGVSGRPEGSAGGHFQVTVMAHGQAGAEITQDLSPTLNCNHEQPIVFGEETSAHMFKVRGGCDGGGKGYLGQDELAFTMSTHQYRHLFSYAIQSTVIDRKPENSPRGSGFSDDVSFTLTQRDQHAVAYGIQYCDANGTRKDRVNGGMYITEPEVAQALTTAEHPIKIVQNMTVRRLMPVECERLQGFRDGYTNIGTLDKPSSDTHRYKALGNSMAVSVMQWIGKRIELALRKPWQ